MTTCSTSSSTKRRIITYDDCNEADDDSSSYETRTTTRSSNPWSDDDIGLINESTDYMQSETDGNASDSIHTSAAESTEEDNDYDYPWPTSSDDSYAALAEDEVYEKLRIKLSLDKKKKQSQTTPNVHKSTKKLNLKIDTKATNLLATETQSKYSQSSSESINSIDSLYFDATHGKYLSVIIHSSPSSENEIVYISEYDGDNEIENGNEYTPNTVSNAYNNTPIQSNAYVTPIQSTCESYHSDLFGCILSEEDH